MNHSNAVKQQYEELQYSRKNPPPSVSVADSRIDELDVTIEHIAAQLDFKKPDDFPSDDDYSDWQKNAISAMSYVRAEHKFLVQWVEKSAKVATLPRLTKNPTALKEVKSLAVARGKPEVVHGLVGEVSELHKQQFAVFIGAAAASLRSRYTQIYYREKPPENELDALRRFAAVKRFRNECEHMLTDINTKLAETGVSMSGPGNIKSPLIDVGSQILSEQKFLRQYLDTICSVNWNQQLISIIERLTSKEPAGPLTLTERELLLVDAFKAEIEY